MAHTVFISGAAVGIGRAAAELLAARGWIVGAYDINSDPTDDFGWAKANPNILTGHLDVTKPESWEAALADFAERTGHRAGQQGIDVVVNNAGILYAGAFAEAGSFEADSNTVDVNVKGVLYGARAAYPYLKRAADSNGTGGANSGRSRGRDQYARLVNIASASAIYGTPDMATYSATKFAVRGITEALDVEWEQDGILVTALWPLYVGTAMLDGVETVGTKRMGVRLTSQDVAKAIADAVEAPRSTPAKTHRAVGLQAKLMHASSHFSPGFLTRFVNAKLTTDRKVRF